MKNRLFFLVLLSGAYLNLISQCDTGSEPECTCETAPVLCSVNDLDGYSSSMSPFLHPDDGPDNFCPPTGLFTNNPTWFAFIAWCEDITMEVEYENCTTVGGFTGAQLTVYTDCSFSDQVDCDSQCQDNSTVSLDLTNLIIGESYYVMLDGCNGSACDYEISVSPTDCDEFIEDWEDPVTEDLVVCIDQTVLYQVDQLTGATNWHWYLDGEELEITDSPFYSIDWTEEGMFELCVDVSNICLDVGEDPEPNCETITVGNPDAGMIEVFDTPECPLEDIEIDISEYNMGDIYVQYLIITNMDGEVVDIVMDISNFDFTWPGCGMFTVYSLNFPEDELVPIPDLDDLYFGSDCMMFCCDENITTIQFIDDDAPVFESAPADVTIDCYLQLEELGLDEIETLDVDDNCVEDIEVMGTETIMADTCNGGTIVREWTYTDLCGNVGVHTQTITILPLIMPQYLNPLSDTSMSNLEYENYNIPELQYTNGQSGTCLMTGVSMADIEDNRSGCGGFVVLNYSFIDSCGRELVDTQRIDIITDVIATDTTAHFCDIDQTGFVLLERSDLDSFITNDLTGVTIKYYPTEADLEAATNELVFPLNSDTLPEQKVYTSVVDASGCRSEIIINISVRPLPVLDLNSQPESCLGYQDGIITVEDPIDLTNYILIMEEDTINSNTITGLSPNLYHFTLIDSLGCSVEDSSMVDPGIDLAFINVSSICNDNMTGTDDTDDFYQVEFIVTGGIGTYQLDVSNMPAQGVYNYDENVSLTLPADGQALTLIAEDLNLGCITEFELNPLIHCSNQCALTLEMLEYTCNDNGTPLDPADDYYEFMINVSAINEGISGNYNLYVDNVLSYTFTYDELSMFDLPATNVPVEFLAEDSDISSCQLSTQSGPLTACSDLCQLDISVVSVLCIDPGTPAENDDDLFEVEIVVTGINASSFYQINNGPQQYEYGQIIILDNNLISSGDLLIEVTDSEDNNCTTDISVPPPPPCSSPCELDLRSLIILDCNDNMTGMNSNDDFFNIRINVDSILGTGNTYLLTDNMMNEYGPVNYSFTQEIGPFPADGTTINLTLSDPTNSSCMLNLSITQESCSECNHSLELTTDVPLLDCQETESLIESEAGNSAVMYNWQGPGGFSGDTESVVVNIPGEYVLTVEYSDGCLLMESIIIESSNDMPVSNAGEDQLLNCEVESVTLSSTLSQFGDDVLISWLDESGNEISNENEIEIDMPGIYGLLLTDTVNHCTSQIDYVEVDQYLNEPVAIIYAEPTNILDCNVMSVHLTYEEEENTIYNWVINGQVIQREELVVEEPQSVELIAIDTISACESDTALNIQDLEIYPLINIENIENLDCITASACVSVSSNSQNELQYAWYDAAGNLVSDEAEMNCFDAAGMYTVELTDLDNGCQNEESFFIEGPVLPTVTLPTLVTLINDQTADIYPNVNVPESQIQEVIWQTSATLSCFNCLNTTIIQAADSTVVNLTIITTEGCVAEASLLINVERIPNVYIPNIFDPGQGVNFTIYTSSDIDRIDELSIYDRWGNQVFVNTNFSPNESSSGWNGTRNGRPLEQGVYVYYVEFIVNDRPESRVGTITLIK